jgi:hypothetical protein
MGAYEASTDLGALHLIGGQHPVLPAGKRVFLVGQLILDPGATLDLTDNDLVSRIRGSLGSWTGSTYDGFMGMIESGALFSSLAKNRYTMLGAATAHEIFGISGYAPRSFDGQSVFADDVLIKFTYDGDANLDGKVNIDDYGRIDANVGQSGIVFGWYNGDFNFDGKINIDDYGLIDSVIGSQGPVL